MSCRHVRAVDALAAGELSPRRREIVVEHVRACAGCAARLAEQRSVLRAVAGRAPTIAEEREAHARLRRAIADGPSVARVHVLRRRRTVVGAIAALAAAVALVLLVPESRRPDGTASPALVTLGTVSSVRGEVFLDGRPARAGDPVPQGAVITSSADGRIELDLGRARLRVHGGAELRPLEDGAELSRGAVAFDVVSGSGRFEVGTPEGRAVVLGTSFVVERGEDGTEVRVAHGSVRVEAPAGRQVLGAGQRSTARRDGTTSAPASYQARDDELRWSGAPNRELDRAPARPRAPAPTPERRPRVRDLLDR